MEIDLKAYRCPNAQIMANAALQRFIESNAGAIMLTSIEPSLERSLKHRIEHLGLPVQLSPVVSEIEITTELRQTWLSEFDEEDFEDVTFKRIFLITRL